jgi:hypothetical protein
MRLAANIHQAGTPIVLVGSGVPEQFDCRPERRCIEEMHWVTLVCDDHVLEQRLRARPAWRGVTDGFIEAMEEFNAHLHARRDMRVIETSRKPIEATVQEVRSWLHDVGWRPQTQL